MHTSNAHVHILCMEMTISLMCTHTRALCVLCAALKSSQDWHRAYTLCRARSVREASLVIASAYTPVDAAPTYLMDRAASGLPMPTVHVSTYQQHGQPCDDV